MNQDSVTLFPRLIFLSRWLQAPLYFGLIVVLGVCVYEFGRWLLELVLKVNTLDETTIMLEALDLIDVVMIANLLIMVIVGGYEVFVSRLRWLNTQIILNGWMRSMQENENQACIALITISSIHLLRTFMDPLQHNNFAVMWQVLIHLTLVFSVLALAITNKLIKPKSRNNQLN